MIRSNHWWGTALILQVQIVWTENGDCNCCSTFHWPVRDGSNAMFRLRFTWSLYGGVRTERESRQLVFVHNPSLPEFLFFFSCICKLYTTYRVTWQHHEVVDRFLLCWINTLFWENNICPYKAQFLTRELL